MESILGYSESKVLPTPLTKVVTEWDGFDDAWTKFPIWGSGSVSSDYATSIFLLICLLNESPPVTASLRTEYAVWTKPALVWDYAMDLAQGDTAA